MASESNIASDGADVSLSERVEQTLTRMILEGNLAAGERLTEIGLATRLGVSRGPVREAFRSLEASGLVTNERNRGAVVRGVSLQAAVEIQEVRAALDDMAARAAAGGRLTAIQITQLGALVAQMDAVCAMGDVAAFYGLNLQFHEQIIRCVGNAKLIDIYLGLIKELHLFRRTGLMEAGEMQRSNREHRMILERIAAGDPDGASRAMREHTGNRRYRMLLQQPLGTAQEGNGE